MPISKEEKNKILHEKKLYLLSIIFIYVVLFFVIYYFGFFGNFGTSLFNTEFFIYALADAVLIIIFYIKILQDYGNS